LDLLIRNGRYAWTVQQPHWREWHIYPNCQPSELYQQSSPVQEELSYLVRLPRRIKQFKTIDCHDWGSDQP